MHCYLDKKDAMSTGNIHKHAKICWGANTVRLATEAQNLQDTCKVLAKSKDGSVAAAFQVKGKGKGTVFDAAVRGASVSTT